MPRVFSVGRADPLEPTQAVPFPRLGRLSVAFPLHRPTLKEPRSRLHGRNKRICSCGHSLLFIGGPAPESLAQRVLGWAKRGAGIRSRNQNKHERYRGTWAAVPEAPGLLIN